MTSYQVLFNREEAKKWIFVGIGVRAYNPQIPLYKWGTSCIPPFLKGGDYRGDYGHQPFESHVIICPGFTPIIAETDFSGIIRQLSVKRMPMRSAPRCPSKSRWAVTGQSP